MNRIYLLLLISLLCSCACNYKPLDEPTGNNKDSYKVFKRPENLQVLANADELWAFIEFRWYREHPAASSRKWIGDAYEQFVLAHDGTNWSPVIFIPTYQGPTFHANITAIIRFENQFLAWSTNYPLQKWSGKRFERLDAREASKILERLEVRSEIPLFQFEKLAQKSMSKIGWSVLHQSSNMAEWQTVRNTASEEDVTFQWKKKQFYLIPKVEGKNKVLNIVEKGPGDMRTFTKVIEYNIDPILITRQEYEKLMK